MLGLLALPGFLAADLVICRNKSPHAFITAGRAGNDEIAYCERCGCAVVVLMPVRHLRFPEKLSVTPVERDHMCVIREHEKAVTGNSDAAVEPNSGVAT